MSQALRAPQRVILPEYLIGSVGHLTGIAARLESITLFSDAEGLLYSSTIRIAPLSAELTIEA